MTRLSIMRPATLTVTGWRQGFLLLAVVLVVQRGGAGVGNEVVRVRDPGFAQFRRAVRRSSGFHPGRWPERSWSVMVGISRNCGCRRFQSCRNRRDPGMARMRVATLAGEDSSGGVEFLELGQRGKCAGSLERIATCMSVSTMPGASETTRARGLALFLDHARVHVQRRLGGAVHAPAGVGIAARAGRDVQHAAVGRKVLDRGQEARSAA